MRFPLFDALNQLNVDSSFMYLGSNFLDAQEE